MRFMLGVGRGGQQIFELSPKQVLERCFRSGKLTRFVLDEAHCISQWGHDFRDKYLKLKYLQAKFPGVKMVGREKLLTRGVVSTPIETRNL